MQRYKPVILNNPHRCWCQSRLRDERIFTILRQSAARANTAAPIRRNGMSREAFYRCLATSIEGASLGLAPST